MQDLRNVLIKNHRNITLWKFSVNHKIKASIVDLVNGEISVKIIDGCDTILTMRRAIREAW